MRWRLVFTKNSRYFVMLMTHIFPIISSSWWCILFQFIFSHPIHLFSTRKLFHRIFAQLKISFRFFFRFYHLKCTPDMAAAIMMSIIWYIVSNEIFSETIISSRTPKFVGFLVFVTDMRWETHKVSQLINTLTIRHTFHKQLAIAITHFIFLILRNVDHYNGHCPLDSINKKKKLQKSN